MIRTQVYLTPDLHREISLTARKEKKAAALVLRELLEAGLQTKKNTNSIGKALLQLSNIKGQGPKNLSTTIDDYLYKE